jgi:predicted DsbA family dithiol-disulfide isomerase
MTQETELRTADAEVTTLPVAIFADFVCPYSYLASDQIDRLAREYNVRPIWRPHWLHPETPLEGMPRHTDEHSPRRGAVAAWLKEMAPEQAERMRFPTKLQCSFLAFQAMEFAEDYGKALPMKSAIFDALWVQGEDIAQVPTLMAAADSVGLDAEALGRAIYDQTYMERALAAVVQARNIGITNTPTMILGRTRINGWHYYEVLQSVLEKQGLAPRSETPA